MMSFLVFAPAASVVPAAPASPVVFFTLAPSVADYDVSNAADG